MQNLANISWLIPLLPLLGAAVAGFAGARWLRGQSHWPIWAGVGISAGLSLLILFTMIGAEPNHTLPAPGSHAAAEHDEAPERAAEPQALELEGAAEAHDAGHGPDHHVKAWTARWYTWIAAGDPAAADKARALGHPVRPGDAKAYTRSTADDTGFAMIDVEESTFESGYLDVAAGAFLDPLTAVMLCVVCGIGFLITVFAAGYMKGEEGYWRFFAYLGLFIFAMTILVMGDNLVMLYLGWEGVGLCSYLLIGYYYQRPAARDAARKAFIVNRIGDFGFAIGIMLIFYCFGTVSYFGDGPGSAAPGFVEMFANWREYVPRDRWALVPVIPFALMLGAFGKSAQFPLYVWLPDAMEGPTPVSALIHAATMVTAGVYMIARLGSVFFQFPAALVTVALVGAFTAAFAATIAMRQFDLKKVFAYSTVSQLGYMFVGVAVLAPAAGIFHLVTHAFFKALLFLSSGVVMHAMLGHLDLRKMSGLKTVLPTTRWLMLIGCCALAGFPLTSGFFSKDEIIHFAGHTPLGEGLGWTLWIVLVATAFLTAYYTFRLYFRVFEGPTVVPDTPAPEHVHDENHDEAHVHGHASASAVQAGDTFHSGVDLGATTDVQGRDRNDVHGHGHGHHNHEPAIMILPLVVLAVGAIFAGFLNLPGVHSLGSFLGNSPSFELGYAAGAQEFGSRLHGDGFGYGGEAALGGLALGALISLLGIGLAWYLHVADRARAGDLAHRLRPAALLLEGKYFVDELYDALIIRPLRMLARAFYAVDWLVVDGLVWLLGFIPQFTGLALRLVTQRGYVQGYAVSMLFGVAVILLVLFL
jgi:NADH-quinone oxidoreductase subunit L